MIKVKRVHFLIVITLLLLLSSKRAFAEERSIYVGDLINLQVSTQSFTEDELRDKFKDFEIVELKNDAKSYFITLRSFETGEKTIQLGDKEIKITIKSTLEEIDRKDVFEGNLKPKKAGISVGWKYLLYTLLLVFIVSFAINLVRLITKRKLLSFTPYQNFINQTNQISLKDEECFVQLSLCLKNYLEASYSCHIKGKTSEEILEELNIIPELKSKTSLFQPWFEESDYYKFTGTIASLENRQKLLEKLRVLVRTMEEEKEVTV